MPQAPTHPTPGLSQTQSYLDVEKAVSTNYLTLGPTPYDEVCTPNTGDKRKIDLENKLYKEQLERQFAHLKNIRFVIKSFPHDFGSYSEVCVVWTEEDEVGQNQAYDVDTSLPDKWDETALEALAIFAMKAP